MGPQRRSGRFPGEVNMLLLSGIERRSPGHYPVADHYTSGVQIDGPQELAFMKEVRQYTCINKTERLLLF
jgi:hypothetical protein